MLQSCLNFLPEHAEFINEHCAKVCEHGRVAIHNASGVMLSYLESDDYGRRMVIGLLAVERLANAAELSDAFGVSDSTVYRLSEVLSRKRRQRIVAPTRRPRGL